jgi:ABC-type transporter Mla subunit MlaD
MNSNLLDLFIIAMSIAVILQMGILVALLVSVRKSSARMESLAGELHRRALPALDTVHHILADSRPRLNSVMENVSATTGAVRAQAERLEATLDDVLDRARLQVIRADELASRALDHVEVTAENVQGSIAAPARQLSGVMQGVAAGLEAYFRGNRTRRRGEVRQDEEMFI